MFWDRAIKFSAHPPNLSVLAGRADSMKVVGVDSCRIGSVPKPFVEFDQEPMFPVFDHNAGTPLEIIVGTILWTAFDDDS